jgi:predicted DNA-binding transcriptional regulator AlpA
LNVNAEGDGIWNCPSVLKGTYLALMTKPGCDIKRWKIAEIRAWSRKDISNSATLLVSGTAPVPNWLIGPATLFDYYSEGSFPYVVDLGSLLELQTVYISFHTMKNLDLVYISTGITEPETSQTPPSLENSASYTQSNNNEEWYFN